MSNWEQRGNFLVSVAQRCLRGQKSFNLCRSHLVKASQISKGTVYNHFTNEADLVVAVAIAEFRDFLQQALQDEETYADPLHRFLYHHCWRMRDVLCNDRFVISRVMPNTDLLEQAGEYYQAAYNKAWNDYNQWNKDLIREMGEVQGFDRGTLVRNFVRGTMVNIDEGDTDCCDIELYHQYCYALAQLLGHSDKRIPTRNELSQWLIHLQQAA
ncbi:MULTISPECIES: TetR/AcrR family transcriptional regulator [Ferrimonas]|uniref:TetR/AcrR family transcriptional regulator n=1 Tax=Ferrimonas TaxID=44011 RepID=UPI00047F35E8|nr:MULTISPECIES: TetR/AcrR family transcriptional regulator [Ferrimonas]USD36582.1 TetR/AcrR family transcriptional regulator [Ferrimonas sp. SCSIO 43195]